MKIKVDFEGLYDCLKGEGLKGNFKEVVRMLNGVRSWGLDDTDDFDQNDFLYIKKIHDLSFNLLSTVASGNCSKNETLTHWEMTFALAVSKTSPVLDEKALFESVNHCKYDLTRKILKQLPLDGNPAINEVYTILEARMKKIRLALYILAVVPNGTALSNKLYEHLDKVEAVFKNTHTEAVNSSPTQVRTTFIPKEKVHFSNVVTASIFYESGLPFNITDSLRPDISEMPAHPGYVYTSRYHCTSNQIIKSDPTLYSRANKNYWVEKATKKLFDELPFREI
ncbi:MAG: hypothetical protein ACHP6I_00005 [Rickettsiales bacterium]